MSDEALDFLVGGGGPPTASFPEKGSKVQGKVLKYELTQQRDFASKTPLFWDDEKTQPKMQVVVTLQLEEYEPIDDDDNGQRRLFVKGGMRTAVGDAIRATGHKGSIVGGTLGVKYVKDGKPPKPGLHAPKEFLAQFTPPSAADVFDAHPDPTPADDLAAYSTDVF